LIAASKVADDYIGVDDVGIRKNTDASVSDMPPPP